MNRRIKYYLLSFLMATISLSSFSQNKKEGNTIYKYKTYEEFDLGNLEIKGEIIAPGDLSVQERKRKVFNRALLERLHFKKEIREDILGLH